MVGAKAATPRDCSFLEFAAMFLKRSSSYLLGICDESSRLHRSTEKDVENAVREYYITRAKQLPSNSFSIADRPAAAARSAARKKKNFLEFTKKS
jgi:hypothetical protein